MELSLIMKTRITAAIAVGIILIGFFAWPVVGIENEYQPVTIASNSLNAAALFKLALWSIAATLIAFLISWPYGKHIASLAAPFGFAVLAIRGGDMTELIRQNPAAQMRTELYSQLGLEPLIWFALIALNLLIVQILASFLRKIKGDSYKISFPKSNTIVNSIIAVVIAVLISKFMMLIFAQAVKIPDNKLQTGFVIAQVTTAQAFFAAVLSFGIAAYLIKKYLDLGYFLPIIAAALLQPVVYLIYLRPDIIEHFAEFWPFNFYSNSITSIMPIEMVSFATIGALAGYWIAVKSIYLRKTEV